MRTPVIALLIALCSTAACAAAAPGDFITNGPWLDVRAFANLSTACADPSTAGKEIWITRNQTANNWHIPPDRTIVMKGGIITVNSGRHLTGLKESTPEMFGSVGMGADDDTTPLSSAFYASDHIKLTGKYKITGTITKRSANDIQIEFAPGAAIHQYANVDALDIYGAGQMVVDRGKVTAFGNISGTAVHLTSTSGAAPSAIVNRLIVDKNDGTSQEFKYGLRLTDCAEATIDKPVISGIVTTTGINSHMTAILLDAKGSRIVSTTHINSPAVYDSYIAFKALSTGAAGIEGIYIEEPTFVNNAFGIVGISTGYGPPHMQVRGGHINSYDTNILLNAAYGQSDFSGILLWNHGNNQFFHAINTGVLHIHDNTYMVIGSGDPAGIVLDGSGRVFGGDLLTDDLFYLKSGTKRCAININGTVAYESVHGERFQQGSSFNNVCVQNPSEHNTISGNAPLDGIDVYDTVKIDGSGNIDVSKLRARQISISTASGTIDTITARMGQEFILSAANGVIIAHGSTIQLRNAADYTFGDRGSQNISMFYNGTQIIEKSRQ